ncbi:hypothetical protein KKI93_20780 [Xenorhabdus bovienii]|uniref:hypothetical protein n=1 Tax=Xenorhabdus bovienii TaxID=40576 RepID=UPI0023B34C20|nr:hypothetical protein [Xenorhabdus bovienii]MDE9566399.1 hypothetical protein [Xenorhabdus bovienii]
MGSWMQVINVISGGVITLITVYFTNKWNTERFDKQIQHEREKESKKFLIEKGEKLFVLLCSFVEWGSKRLDRDFKGKVPTKHEFDYIELELIVKAYFPEFEEDVGNLLEFLPGGDHKKSSNVFDSFLEASDVLKDKICFKLNELTE